MTSVQDLITSTGILTTLIVIGGVLLTLAWKRDDEKLHKTK
jgi:hypothetical protein